MTATVVKFPFKLSRRAHARRPRTSKNGTPEERAAKQGIQLTRVMASALALNMMVMRHDDGSLWLVDRDLFREMVEKGELDPGCSIQ